MNLERLFNKNRLTSVKSKLKEGGRTSRKVSKIINAYSDANYWNLQDRLENVSNKLESLNLNKKELKEVQGMNASRLEDYLKRVHKLSNLEYEGADVNELINNLKGNRKEVVDKYLNLHNSFNERILRNPVKKEKRSFTMNKPQPSFGLKLGYGLATVFTIALNLNSYTNNNPNVTQEAINNYFSKQKISINSPKLLPYINTIFDVCENDTNITPELIGAVILGESNGDSTAVSPAGAEGPMQLMPETAKKLGVTNSFDPTQNILGGSKYLSSLISLYDGNEIKALAGYNAGPTRVDKWIKRGWDGKNINWIPFDETREYVKKVLSKSKKLSNV